MTAKTNGSQSYKTPRRKETQPRKKGQDAEPTEINVGHVASSKPDSSWWRLDKKPLSGRPIKSRGIVIKKYGYGHPDFELSEEDKNATDAIRYELFKFIVGKLEYAQHIQGGTTNPFLVNGKKIKIDGKPLMERRNAKIIYGYAGDISDWRFASLVTGYLSILSQENVAKSQKHLTYVLVILTVITSAAALVDLLKLVNFLH